MGTASLITGASSGIGLAFAQLLASEGDDLVLVSRSTSKLEEIARDLREAHGVSVTVAAADLTDRSAVDKLVQTLDERELSIDTLISSAGSGERAPLLDSDWDTLRPMIDLNVVAVTQLTHVFGKKMAERGGGMIVNVASTAAFQPGPLMSVYYATKAYVLSFSEALAWELRDHGVTVTTVCPGPVQTGFQLAAGIQDIRLMRLLPLTTAEQVARIGMRGARKGKTCVVVGRTNSFLAGAARIAPRSISTRVAAWINAD